MITRNINDDNTLSYLFNSNSKAVKKTDEKVDAADKKIDSEVGRLEQSFGDEIERLETLIGEVGIPSGGSQGQYLVKSSADDYAVGWESHGMDLLWENASVNSAFAAQTISIDLSAYDFIILDFYTMITAVAQGGAYISRIEPVDGLQRIVNERNGTISGDYGYGSRGFTVAPTGVTFLNGLSQSSWTPSGTQNGFMVPYKIYGIR